MTTHTCIRILYCRVYPQLPPVIGAPWGCCGHASEIYSPRPLWFGGCATHATPCSVPGYSYFRMCLEKSERDCFTSYLYNAAILASFFLFACLKACFRLSLSTKNKKKQKVTSKKHAYRPETSYCVYYSLNPMLLPLGNPNISLYFSSSTYVATQTFGQFAPPYLLDALDSFRFLIKLLVYRKYFLIRLGREYNYRHQRDSRKGFENPSVIIDIQRRSIS